MALQSTAGGMCIMNICIGSSCRNSLIIIIHKLNLFTCCLVSGVILQILEAMVVIRTKHLEKPYYVTVVFIAMSYLTSCCLSLYALLLEAELCNCVLAVLKLYNKVLEHQDCY